MKNKKFTSSFINEKEPEKIIFSKSRTELNTPEFAEGNLTGSFRDGNKNLFSFSRLSCRTKTMQLEDKLFGQEDLSPVGHRKSSSPKARCEDFNYDDEFALSPVDFQNIVDPTQAISAAKESLYQIRQEAKGYFNSVIKLVQDSQKSRRSSLESDELRNFLSVCSNRVSDPLKELSENINSIKNRVLLNELTNEQQLESDLQIKETLDRINERLSKTRKKGRTNSLCICDSKNCLII